MQLQPSKKDRWIALGMLVLLVAAAYLVLVHPWFTQPLYRIDTQIEALRDRQLHLRMQLAQAPRVAALVQRVNSEHYLESGFLPEPSAELASVGLVERLERTVVLASPNNRSCTITNRSPLQPEVSERFTRVSVQVRLRCGTPELVEILYSLESSAPSLFVNNLNIMAQRYQLSSSESGNGLDVAFELSGYLRAHATSPVPAEKS